MQDKNVQNIIKENINENRVVQEEIDKNSNTLEKIIKDVSKEGCLKHVNKKKQLWTTTDILKLMEARTNVRNKDTSRYKQIQKKIKNQKIYKTMDEREMQSNRRWKQSMIYLTCTRM